MKRVMLAVLLAAGLAAVGCSYCDPNRPVCYGPLGRPYYVPHNQPNGACCTPTVSTYAPPATTCVPTTTVSPPYCPPGTVPAVAPR